MELEEENISLDEAFERALGVSSAARMDWIETLRRLSGKSLRGFAKDCDTSHGHLRNLMDRESRDHNLWMRRLCLMRRSSGLTWTQLGKMWDKIYLDDE